MPFLAADPLPDDPPPGSRVLLLPLAFIALLIVALTAAVVVREFRVARDAADAALQSVGDLRQAQVQAWLRDRLDLGRFISTSALFARQYGQQRQPGHDQALKTLMGRLVELRRTNDSDEVLLLDENAQLVWRERADAQALPTELRDVALQAMRSGKVQHTEIYRSDHGTAPVLRLDIVVPLLETGSPARAVVVLRQDPTRQLFPLLATWPVPSETGETLLLRRHGGQVLALSPFRFRPDSATRLVRSSTEFAPAGVLGPHVDERGARAIAGTDYRGHAVMAAGRRIEGTDWLLVSKLDQAEIDAPARTLLAWAAGLALAALLALAAGARLFVQRAALRGAANVRDLQQRRLQALKLLQAVIDNSSEVIFAKDRAGRYLLFNRAGAQALGRPASEVIGKTAAELFPPEVAARLVANDAGVMQAGQNTTFEDHLMLAGTPHVHISTKGPLRDADGQVNGLFCISRDVTEARRAEQALRESEARYRSVFEVLSAGILVRDLQGRVLSCNPAAAQLLEAAADSIVGSLESVAGWVALGDDDQPLPHQVTPFARVLVTLQPQPAQELPMRGPAGQRRWFSVSARPVLDPRSGLALAVVVSFQDVTRRRELDAEVERHHHHLQELVDQRTQALQQANEQLADAERFLRLVADNLPVRIVYWDRDGVCRFGNRAYFEWYGVTPEQSLGRTAREIHGEDHYRRYGHQLDAALQGERQVFERESTRADGSFWQHQVHYIPDRADDGSVRGIYALALDITPIRQAEARQRGLNAELATARDRAEEANRAKSAFLANMSHEIRTPMNAIIGLTHLMQRDAVDSVQRDRLGKVSTSAQHLLQVINDILDLSKIEAGRMALEDLSFSLDALLGRAFHMVSEAAQAKGLELIVDTDHLPDALRGDPTRLSQALLNLLSNAVKFTEHGWVRLVGEKLVDDGQRVLVRFAVSDSGVGIAADRLPALFKVFEQVDSSTSRRHGGTGLGLALTRRLASMMGGEAGAESEPGVGSRFWFTAWLGRSAEEPEGGPELAGRRVLLADDLAEARAALADRLQQFGMPVDAVDSGPAALARFEQAARDGQRYDLLMIDWRMPGLDGISTLRRLRERFGDSLPPALLVTAHDDETMQREARGEGFAAVLLKPITASTLHDSLRRVLQRDTSAPPPAPQPQRAEAALRRRAAGSRVLLAEDNPINQQVAMELLRGAGLEVDLADDGAQAITMALAAPYALIVMDVQMPGVDGIEAARELRRRGCSAPIIAMTANAFDEDRDACLAAGMVDHVSKPVDPEVLYATLLRWLPEMPPGPTVGATDDAADAGWLAALARVPGIDAALALRAAAGNAGLARRLVTRFVEHYTSGLPVLSVAGGEERLPAWRAAAHSLQGSCGAIGASALQAGARDLEARARAAATAAELQADALALDAALRALVGALQAGPGRTLQ